METIGSGATMADEGWRQVWAIPTVDTNGKPIRVFVGQVDHKGRVETAVRIDNGPTALLPPVEQVVGRFLEAIRKTAENTWKQNET